jgi:hypothetical protein
MAVFFKTPAPPGVAAGDIRCSQPVAEPSRLAVAAR